MSRTEGDASKLYLIIKGEIVPRNSPQFAELERIKNEADYQEVHHITGFVAQCDTAGQSILTKEDTTEVFPAIPIGTQTVVITGLDIPAAPGAAVSIAVGAGTSCKVTMYGYSEIG